MPQERLYKGKASGYNGYTAYVIVDYVVFCRINH